MKTILMSSAALLLLASAPALAGKSTRAEVETTRQLNLQASQAAPSAPAAPASEVMAMNAPPSAAPTTRVESASMDGAATLSSINNPPSKIATANVLDSSGKIVGAVQRVEVTPQGQPTKVAVALIGKDEQMIVLDAGAVLYDAGKNQIMAQATADQLKAMPNKS